MSLGRTVNPRAARFAVHGTPVNPRLHDHAKDILLGANIAQEDKAAAWEHYHDARDGKDLSARLKGVVPDEIKNQLVAAKDKSIAPDEPDAVDKVVEGINRIGEIAPKVSPDRETTDGVEAVCGRRTQRC
jgi:hypothetical protein